MGLFRVHAAFSLLLLATACAGKDPVGAGGASSATATSAQGSQSATSGAGGAPTTSGSGGNGGSGGLPAVYFGLDMNRNTTAWPTVPFGTLRLWDSAVAWTLLEPASGNFSWAPLDAWLDEAEQHGVEVLYTFGRTPMWASADKTDATCSFGPGQCQPPLGLAADGTGDDSAFSGFADALVAHVGNRIHYYEVWNEVNNVGFWKGTAPQLVRFAADVHAAIAKANVNAKVLTPSTCNCNNGSLTAGTKATTNPQDGMDYYLAATYAGMSGADLAEGVAFHPYLGNPAPEGIVGLTRKMKTTMQNHGIGALPLWDTESSWGKNHVLTSCPASDTGPFSMACESSMGDFAARSLILAAGEGTTRFLWYQWENGSNGTLWQASTGPLGGAKAYATVSKWLTGAGLAPCVANGTSFSCDVTRAGYKGRILWDTAGPSMADVPNDLVEWQDLAGTTHSPLVTPLTIGTSPILLQSGPIP